MVHLVEAENLLVAVARHLVVGEGLDHPVDLLARRLLILVARIVGEVGNLLVSVESLRVVEETFVVQVDLVVGKIVLEAIVDLERTVVGLVHLVVEASMVVGHLAMVIVDEERIVGDLVHLEVVRPVEERIVEVEIDGREMGLFSKHRLLGQEMEIDDHRMNGWVVRGGRARVLVLAGIDGQGSLFGEESLLVAKDQHLRAMEIVFGRNLLVVDNDRLEVGFVYAFAPLLLENL